MEIASSTSKRSYDSIDVGHELAFIPFAKTSKTFIKKAGNNANDISAVEYLWTSNSTDDAKVPRLEDGDRDSYTALKDVQESPVHRKVGGTKKNDKVLNAISSPMLPSSPTSTLDSQAQKVQLGLPSTRNTTLQSIGAGGNPVQGLYRGQAHFQEQLEQQQQQHIQFAQDQYEVSEIVLEMPPPRLSRRLRKSNSLNQKYARMKHDMELISQDATLQLGNSSELFDSTFAASFAPTFTYGSSLYPPNLRTSRPNGHTSYGATTSYRDSTLHEAYQKIQQPFEQYTMKLRSSSIPSNYDLPISDSGIFESAATSARSIASPRSSFRGDSRAYSMPYFRFSSLPSFDRNRADQTLNESHAPYHIPYGENGRKISRDDHLDCPTSESILNGHERTDDTVLDPYLLPGSNVNIICANEGQPGSLTDALVPPATDSKSQIRQNRYVGSHIEAEQQHHTPRVIHEELTGKHEQGHEYSHELFDQPPPACTLFDKIHKIGSEIKASASTTVPRFGAGSTVTRDMEMEQERRKQRQKSRFEISVKPSTSLCTQVHPQLDLLQLSFKAILPNGKHTESCPPSTAPGNSQTVITRIETMDTIGIEETAALITSTADNQSSESLVIGSGQLAPMTASDSNSQQAERNQRMATRTSEPDSDLERISMLEQEIQSLAENN
ncbi:hypothetical protein BGX26_011888 [Mortierella sp. AD094]|nr:hypothetical protein BGX26_011888 [Mortierella sp. AD094]